MTKRKKAGPTGRRRVSLPAVLYVRQGIYYRLHIAVGRDHILGCGTVVEDTVRKLLKIAARFQQGVKLTELETAVVYGPPINGDPAALIAFAERLRTQKKLSAADTKHLAVYHLHHIQQVLGPGGKPPRRPA